VGLSKAQGWPGFWGKWDNANGRWLPLAAHCLDVAVCFRKLCSLPAIQRALYEAAGRVLTEQDLDRLAVLAMLHDIGKANRGFQRKVLSKDAPRVSHLREIFGVHADDGLLQGFLDAISVNELASWFAQPEDLEGFLFAAWSHHGDVLDAQQAIANKFAYEKWWRDDEEIRPMDGVREVLSWARQAFARAFAPSSQTLPASSALQHLFAGLLMLADWLGSSSEDFPIEPVSCSQRLTQAQQSADRLFARIGLDAGPFRARNDVGASFEERFGFAPRPLQAALDAIHPEDRLWIVEAETGSGKTEAALHVFFTLFAQKRVDGLYFALPTRVAARNLYTRVCRYVERVFPKNARPPVLLAVPGYAQVDGMELPDFHANRHFENTKDRFWAAEHPKRFLAATIAVGTVDQALLGIVQTKHAHLRLGLLARQLLVVDEVHASDSYMAALLEHLLDWHLRRLKGYAVLLSATLGASARHRFLQKALGELASEAPGWKESLRIPYPAVWKGRRCEPIRSVGERTVALSLLPLPAPRPAPRKRIKKTDEVERLREEERLSESIEQWDLSQAMPLVREALQAGARVLVVLNTVRRANLFVQAAEAAGLAEVLFAIGDVRCPHHGRFAAEDRLVLDRAVVDRFGKGAGAGPCLLIGTQTLEQSLDIDADFLLTDLCPADVLLQRLGRLHRHQRDARPQGYETPQAVILTPSKESLLAGLGEDGLPSADLRAMGLGSHVYADLRALELTRRLIAERKAVRLPDEARLWVESITHPEALRRLEEEDERWQAHGQKVEGTNIAQGIAADMALIDLTCPFTDLRWREKGEPVRVRLGADGYTFALSSSFPSPFGQEIREITVPGWMLGNKSETIDKFSVLKVEQQGEGVLLYSEAFKLRLFYDRFGLQEVKDA